jgi:hypothetical protein
MKENSQGLTKQQVNELYNEKVPEASKQLVNKHVHWPTSDNWCRLCGRKVVEEEK